MITSRKFNVDTGQWEIIESTSGGRPQPITPANTEKPPETPSVLDNNKVSDEAQKEFLEAEDNILSGDANILPNPNIRARKTVELEGIGKYLSGIYFVESARHDFSGSGYTHVLNVSRRGFGDSMKKGMLEIPKPEPPVVTDRPAEVSPPVSTKEHTIVGGDTLWALAVKHYGDGSQWGRIAQANNLQPGDERRLQIGTKLIIPT